MLPETEVTDAISVLGTEGFGGTASWKLLGPVAPVAGECEAADWTGAPTVDQGTIAIAGDETKSTTATKITAHGCYGYEVTLAGEHLATVTSPVGSVHETVLVHPATPTVGTHASAASVLPGSGSPIGSRSKAPTASKAPPPGGSPARWRRPPAAAAKPPNGAAPKPSPKVKSNSAKTGP